VSSLFSGGADRLLKKVVEEAGEVVLSSKNGKREEIVHEVADLLFHTLVALGYHDISLQEVYDELAGRTGKSGLRQRAERPR
jgi:phosphoribosyl-ATP pyrophosphohydrolase